MSMKRQSEDENIEKALESQLDNIGGESIEKNEKEETPAGEQTEETPSKIKGSRLGKHLLHNIGSPIEIDQEGLSEARSTGRFSGIGGNIYESGDFREGWIEVDRALLGERDKFYPEDWVFRIKPANVEAIKNWSTINEQSANSIDDVFNEILRSCLAIRTPLGNRPWHEINSWDRFFFVMLIREYTFKDGESKIEYTEDCPNCGEPVTFTLNSQALMYDMPDQDVLVYFDGATRVWSIPLTEYGIENGQELINLYVPTLEKDANIKMWLISKLQENRNFKVDQVFLKFLPWLVPKVSKDANIAKNQIRAAEMQFKSWDIEMFTFMDEVLRNIIITPGTNLLSICPACGEEVTSPIRFQHGISSLFNVQRKSRKFGKK